MSPKLLTFLMSFPFESLSLKLMKLLGEVGAEVCLQGTMLNLRLSCAVSELK